MRANAILALWHSAAQQYLPNVCVCVHVCRKSCFMRRIQKARKSIAAMHTKLRSHSAVPKNVQRITNMCIYNNSPNSAHIVSVSARYIHIKAISRTDEDAANRTKRMRAEEVEEENERAD